MPRWIASQLSHAACIMLITTLIQFVSYVEAGNWAQVSGVNSQSVTIPYIPAVGNPHWKARFGQVTIVTPSSVDSTIGFVFVLGGDTYSKDGSNPDILVADGWENGYKNDVWVMTGTEWFKKGDPKVKTKYKQKIPQIKSMLRYELVQDGLHPPLGTTYDNWIRCEAFFRNLDSSSDCPEDVTSIKVQWSPRRHHAGVYFKGYLWIMGGRAREFEALPEERSIGGIIGKRIKDINSTFNPNQQFSSQREAIVLKSDVWRSADGSSWELVTPGCKAPQLNLISGGNKKDNLFGKKEFACAKDQDCYGAETCDMEKKTCVCGMWSSREQHQVAAYGDFMYVVGGYASQLYDQFSNCGGYSCGDTDASAYRYYMADVWRSRDGQTWDLLTEKAFTPPSNALDSLTFPLGRGGHQMVAIDDLDGLNPYLYVIAGRGGDNSFRGGPEVFFDDIWKAPISFGEPNTSTYNIRPDTWTQVVAAVSPNDPTPATPFSMPWGPRSGHAVAFEPLSARGIFDRSLYLYGGFNEDGGLEDMWVWRIDDPTEFWRKDFSADALFSTGTGENTVYSANSPASFYVSTDSDLSYLQRYWVPNKFSSQSPAKPLERREYMSPEKVETLKSVGITTIQELADIGVYDVLKLRGWDFPQVPLEDRLDVDNICDLRALAIAIVQRCSVNTPSLYDIEKNMPWNVRPKFGGAPPSAGASAAWHGVKNYDYLLAEVDDPDVLTENWDGCTYKSQIQGLFGPNINGLGYVSQVKKIRNPRPEYQELFCRQTPSVRYYHSLFVFEDRVYTLGGKRDDNYFYADTWYRDTQLPTARIKTKPESYTDYPWFKFVANEPGTQFEYRVWDPIRYEELREWTPVVKKTNIGWLDWREGGPGNGYYTLYVRAIDPAGNRDHLYVNKQNVYLWYYVSPIPWDIIAECIGAFIGLVGIAYFEYRRRVKKAAMERYAMKRMRRKFKAMQRDINGKAVDWRTLYMEAKQAEEAGGFKLKNKKKNRDKNQEKREAEKRKRDKEKEKIKKKLAESKRAKDKAAKIGIVTAVPEKEESKSKKPISSKLRTRVKKEVDDNDAVLDKAPPVAFNAKGKGGAKLHSKKAKSAAAPSGKVGAVVQGDTPEPAAGELKASADAEKGAKQRRVNKRFDAYEQDAVPVKESGGEPKKDN